MNLAHTLKKASLFQNFDSESLEQLAEFCHEKTYPKGRDLFIMGDKADAFFIILQGWVKLYRPTRDGEETIIHVFGPGESFAEAAVFNDSKTYPVNAQAIEDTIVAEIPRNFFVHKIEADSRFALRMLAAIAARQHYLVQQLEQVTTRTAPQRIGTFLIRFCRKEKHEHEGWLVDLPYDKSVISTRLNIKPETFSRALAKLEPYGVHIQGRHIIVKDLKKLADFCDVSAQDTPC
ncbi:Crp/Fnr family transcriptional regulator [Micavibrio aeruginosavorus]|uniref:Transcriptional regulator, Crp/Fnr family n=1 Tax=Micavibrio aeruginosavorus EPB TaxID=349215 RepID=M4VWT6_9BACT|nr:Crp/Fnr family transcriptional regulator [Micavibrio aeruginosavorus]AGH97659.1 transcriptional regulator, Crp/Fnr family [Micavibrio aeruginosavorus EPB]